jgi:hypothetical protein
VPSLGVDKKDGGTTLTYDDFLTFSVDIDVNRGTDGGGAGERFIKFLVFPLLEPSIVFLNTDKHRSHRFMLELLKMRDVPVHQGEISWKPDAGDHGLYAFHLQAWNAPDVDQISLLYDLLTKHMLFIESDLVYWPYDAGRLMYQRDQVAYEAAGIPVYGVREQPDQGEVTTLNEGESYGLLRVFDADERPSILDIAIYRQLPNDVPLLQGIITESPQTPLSHMNLRAVQNGNPNAFIGNASTHPNIASFIGNDR